MTALALILLVPAGLYLVYGLVAFVRDQPARRPLWPVAASPAPVRAA